MIRPSFPIHIAKRQGCRALLPALIASAFTMPLHAADLLTITRDALDNNAELASERSFTSSVREGRDVQEADLRPQVNLQSELAVNRAFESIQPGDDTSSSGFLTLRATQALFDARNTLEVEQADRQIDQQLYRLAATEQQVLIDVSSAYFEILRAYEVLEARHAQERAIARQLEQARDQFEVGLIAITEVEEAQARFDQSRAERIAADSDMQVSFEALERLTGQRYSSIDMLGDEMPIQSPIPADRDHWVELAIENNPLVLASLAGVQVSRGDVEIARTGRLPQVNAFASYRYDDADFGSGNTTSSRGRVGLELNLPLYTGGRTSAFVRQNTFRLESSQYDFEAQRRDTIQQVRSRYTQVSNDVSAVEARSQAIVSNQSALDATRAGYEVGTRNIVDVLNAEQTLYNAIADHASARYDYVINLLSLRQQSGTLDVPAVEDVNGWLDGGSVSFTLPEESDRFEGGMEIGKPPRLEE